MNEDLPAELDPVEEAIFNAAAELPEPELRRAFLDRACGRAGPLRARLEELLLADERAHEFLKADPLRLNRPAADARSVASLPSDEPTGTMIGRYKLLQKIGEGGMGVVFMAEQQEPVARKVALKIIKLGMDTRQVVARFEAERQALALMDHPNIARVLDGGATETGRPYFVMELFQGVPITEFCDRNELPAHERIGLFIQVCHAVQSAHQKGIIHRDLKPSNVLVTLRDGVPVPKVIDFGVAKATHQKLTEKTLFTRYAMMIGTPAYMSPEQAEMSDLDVDTRSDVYSLGVLLYELLTGTTPFPEERLRSAGYGEMQRIIVHEEPERPSTRLNRQSTLGETTSRRHLRDDMRHLQGDLDWVIMKALEKDRARRYETASGLAADLQRHLGHEAVLACPPSATYRFGKWARRNRVFCAAVTAVTSILLLAAVLGTWLAVRASRAEHLAREQALKANESERRATEQAAISQEQTAIARAVKSFVLEQVISANPYVDPVPDPAKRAVVERLAGSLERKFTNQPLIEAELRFTLGKALASLDDYSSANAQFQLAYQIRRDRLGLTASDTLETAAEWADCLWRTGRTREGEKLLEESVAALRNSPVSSSVGGGLVLFYLGKWLTLDQLPHEALPYLRQAVEVLGQTLEPQDDRIKDALLGLGLAYDSLGEKDKAGAFYLDAVTRSVRDHGRDHPETANLELFQGILFLESGKPDVALPILQHARSVFLQAGTTNFSMTMDVDFWLARTYEKSGQWDQAEQIYDSLLLRWPRQFPDQSARRHCSMAAVSLREHARAAKAAAADAQLLESFQTHPPERDWELEMLLDSTARVRGWPAAAEESRKHWNVSTNSLSTWLVRAWICRSVGDDASYQQLVRHLLACTPQPKEGQLHLPIEIAALGVVPFFPDEQRRIDALIASCQARLPQLASTERARGYRAIAHMQLRLGRLPACLQALDKAEKAQTAPEPYSLLIRAACLHQLGRQKEACAALEAAALSRQTQLPGPFSELGRYESHLPAWQLYQQVVFYRETEAELACAPPRAHPPPEITATVR